jgi:hypothetical protein
VKSGFKGVNIYKRLIVAVILVGMLLLALTPIMNAQNNNLIVTWWWKDMDATFSHLIDPNYKFHKLMDKTEPTGTAEYAVTLGPGESAWWYTDEAAECDLTFPAGKWVARYWAEASGDQGSHRVYARLYVVHTDGGITMITQEYSLVAPEDGLVEKIRDLETNSIDVNPGERIAIQIEWYRTADPGDTLTIHYNYEDYKSRLVSPSTSPPWPVPELPTLILFSVGLVGLASLVAFRRLRGKENTPKY